MQKERVLVEMRSSRWQDMGARRNFIGNRSYRGSMMKSRFLKSVNDFIIGVALLGFGVFIVCYKNIVKGRISESVGGYLVRPDVYVRMIGVLLIVCSLILVIKSINFRRAGETKGFRFVMSREVALTALALILYSLALEPAGFAISTFLLTMFLTCLYMRKELAGARNPSAPPRLTTRSLLIAAAYSVAMVIVVYVMFAKVLNVVLPSGIFFE
jgi:hypothetical protein